LTKSTSAGCHFPGEVLFGAGGRRDYAASQLKIKRTTGVPININQFSPLTVREAGVSTMTSEAMVRAFSA